MNSLQAQMFHLISYDCTIRQLYLLFNFSFAGGNLADYPKLGLIMKFVEEVSLICEDRGL